MMQEMIVFFLRESWSFAKLEQVMMYVLTPTIIAV